VSRALLNGLLFNASWLAIVYFHSNPVALGVTAAHLAIHLRTIGYGGREAAFIGAVTLLGCVVDTLLFASGVLLVDGQPAMAPLWLGCLWPVLATTMGHAFASLRSHLWAAVLLGAAGGWGSYSLGIALTPVDFAAEPAGPLVLAGLWAILFPLLVHFASRLEEGGARREAAPG